VAVDDFHNEFVLTDPQLNESDLERFSREGFLIAKRVFDESDLNQILPTVLEVFREYSPGSLDKDYRSWNDSNLHTDMIGLREHHPEQFSSVFQSINQCLILTSFLCGRRLEGLVERLLGDPWGTICLRAPGIRIDTPNDERVGYDWHQDSAYSEINLSGKNSLVCWVPMQHVDKENGSLIVCPQSHSLGRIMVKPTRESSLHAEQRKVPAEYVNRFPAVSVEADFGDAVFVHGDLIHKSGTNRSDRIRFTVVGRYHRTLASDFFTRPDRDAT
jgi:hypothetical protein